VYSVKVIAFNGSPRKKWNTATLLSKTLEGAQSKGAETELIHLYDLNYKGCISCFACKTKGGKSYGRCAVQDDLTPVFKQIEEADAIVLGSPVYFGTVTGEMKSFLERLFFAYLRYSDPPQSLFPKKIGAAFIYTMNITEEQMEGIYDIRQHLFWNDRVLNVIFGTSEKLLSYDTYQFKDYSKVVAERFDPVKKAKRREEVFPQDCARAFEMGIRLVQKKSSGS
jgi:multimeric flavodoxin WrbA